jgi:hypothetical protein
MQKRKLALETLDVTSFDIVAQPAEVRGTVQAHDAMTAASTCAASCASSCPNWTCEGATCARVIC